MSTSEILQQPYHSARGDVPGFVRDILQPVALKHKFSYQGYYHHGMLGQHLIMLGDGSFNGKQIPMMDFVEDYCPEHREDLQILFPSEKTSSERLKSLNEMRARFS